MIRDLRVNPICVTFAFSALPPAVDSEYSRSGRMWDEWVESASVCWRPLQASPHPTFIPNRRLHLSKAEKNYNLLGLYQNQTPFIASV